LSPVTGSCRCTRPRSASWCARSRSVRAEPGFPIALSLSKGALPALGAALRQAQDERETALTPSAARRW
jgi:hypothetical protein